MTTSVAQIAPAAGTRDPVGAEAGDAPMPRDRISARDLWFAAALVAAAAAVMRDAWASIFRLGINSEELSYVLLAPWVTAWVAWSRRARLAECRLRGEWVGLAILLAGYAVYSYGFLTDPVIWRAGAVMAAAGAVLAAVGRDVLFKFLPAFAATVFLIPISPNGRYHLAVPLQNATAAATQVLCDLLGIDVERAGNLLSINGVDVTVAEACNGMRMILTLFMVCYLVAFTLPLRTHLRVLLLLASPVVAVVSNVLRLVPTVWLFGHASAETAETFHTASGWGMTVLAFGVLMWGFAGIQRLLNSAPPPPPATA
jgi:exosortase